MDEVDFVEEQADDGDDEEGGDAAVAAGEVEDDADGGGDGGDEGSADVLAEHVAREGVSVGVLEAEVLAERANDDDEEEDDRGLGGTFRGGEFHEGDSTPRTTRSFDCESGSLSGFFSQDDSGRKVYRQLALLYLIRKSSP